MKLPSIKPIWKFLLGICVYALLTWICTIFEDYRNGFWLFMSMNAVTFGMALWAIIQSKRAVSIILACALALAPVRGGSQEVPKKEWVVPLIAGCAILVVGGVIIWSIHKLCKRLLPPPKKGPKPPNTNPEPDSIVGPILPGSPAPPLIMPDLDLSETASEYEVFAVDYQSSTNGGANWITEYSATNWAGPDRMFCVLYSNNVPLMTNQMRAYWTNETFLMDFSAVMPTKETLPFREWRGVQIQ